MTSLENKSNSGPALSEMPVSSPVQRNASMDVLRLLACVMAVFNHSVSDSQYILPLDSLSWVIIEVFTCIGKVVPGVFFLLSGFFSHSQSTKKALRKGIYYVIVFFLADAFYSVLSMVLNHTPFSLTTLMEGIWNFKYHLWFLTAYAGITMLSPLLNQIKTGDLPYCALLMFVFCIFLPSLIFLFPNSYSIAGFVSIMNGVISKIFVFIGYFLLGRLFREYRQQAVKYRLPALGLTVLAYFVSVIFTVVLSRKTGYVNEIGTDNNSIFVFFACIGLFTVFLGIKISYGKVLAFLIPLTLNIYILHVAFVDILTSLGITCTMFGDGWAVIPGVLLKAAIVFLLSAISAMIIERIKALLGLRRP